MADKATDTKKKAVSKSQANKVASFLKSKGQAPLPNPSDSAPVNNDDNDSDDEA